LKESLGIEVRDLLKVTRAVVVKKAVLSVLFEAHVRNVLDGFLVVVERALLAIVVDCDPRVSLFSYDVV